MAVVSTVVIECEAAGTEHVERPHLVQLIMCSTTSAPAESQFLKPIGEVQYIRIKTTQHGVDSLRVVHVAHLSLRVARGIVRPLTT